MHIYRSSLSAFNSSPNGLKLLFSVTVSSVATVTGTVASTNSTISTVNNAVVVKIYFGRCSLVASTISMGAACSLPVASTITMGAVWLLVIILVVIVLKSALSMSAVVLK